MKIRSGFVSNSSSSSFVLCFPKGYTEDSFVNEFRDDIINHLSETESFEGITIEDIDNVEQLEKMLDAVKKEFKSALTGSKYWYEDDLYGVLSSLNLSKYELESFDVGSDGGEYSILNREALLQQLGVKDEN